MTRVSDVLAKAAAKLAGASKYKKKICSKFLSEKWRKNRNTHAEQAQFAKLKYATLDDLLPVSFIKTFFRPWHAFLYAEAKARIVGAVGDGFENAIVPLHVRHSSNWGDIIIKGQSTEEPIGLRFNSAYGRYEIIADPVSEIINCVLADLVEAYLPPPTRLIPTYTWPVHYPTEGVSKPTLTKKTTKSPCRTS